MLVELKVKNFAIIDSLHLHFREGLNILSGETGAGKSVLLKSLSLLMGEKASTDTIRTGATQAYTEGLFDLSRRPDIQEKLSSLGIPLLEAQLIVRRIISIQGKSRVYINDCLTSLQTLKNLVAPLIDISRQIEPLIELTSQHENKSLQSKAYQMDLLDTFCGTITLRKQVSQLHNEVETLKKELLSKKEEFLEKNKKLDFLEFQLNELTEFQLSEEDANLEEEIRKLKNVHKLIEFSQTLENALYSSDNSVLVQIHHLIQLAEKAKEKDEQIQPFMDSLQEAQNILEETIYDVRAYSQNLSCDPLLLEEKENRLSQLRKLQNKYGSSFEEIQLAHREIEKQVLELKQSDSLLEKIENKLQKKRRELEAQAKNLHERRIQGALLLEESINDQLKELNMNGTKLQIKVSSTDTIKSHGLSDIEFFIKPSDSEPAKPLAKIASGGELSRILLAIKGTVQHSPRTFLFDEVDSGVSGKTAEKVGKKLKTMAKGQQVICVTHLPQVASQGDVHFYIYKTSQNGKIQMNITELKKKERVQEIARLISGEKITPTSLKHAKELLQI